ncbi:MAG: NAD(+)/NADH kinase [Chloroflexi bacterium]|nr:NAD(+)/NADH kinase [Chloroflexota bacterium]
MKRIGFAYNPTNEQALELRERATGWCSMRGIDSWASPAGELEQLLRELPGTDALVVLGGDGTFLRAAQGAALVDVPILGVNCGKVGFLSKAESDAMEGVLGLLLDGAWTIEPRMLLDVRLLPGGDETRASTHLALNDAAVVRGSMARVVRLEISVDASHVATWIADGLVVSSPTGSTGYSFSAGGPILDPTSRNLVVTSIAAYLSAIRTFVVSPAHTVSVRVLDAFDCMVSIDGRDEIPLQAGDEVRVSAHERAIRFIEPRGALPFWELLRRKAALLPS